jgi:hypothetical protein
MLNDRGEKQKIHGICPPLVKPLSRQAKVESPLLASDQRLILCICVFAVIIKKAPGLTPHPKASPAPSNKASNAKANLIVEFTINYLALQE